jgi:hypothetical protein
MGLFDSMSSMLAPLDYPRQALYNLGRSAHRGFSGEGSMDDLVSALPGALGVASLAAAPFTGGLTLPFAMAMAGGAQGVGKALGDERYDAATPADLVEHLGGDRDNPLTTTLAQLATDPLTYAGILGSHKALSGASRMLDRMDATADLAKGPWARLRGAPTEAIGQSSHIPQAAVPQAELAGLRSAKLGNFDKAHDALDAYLESQYVPQGTSGELSRWSSGSMDNMFDTPPQAPTLKGGLKSPLTEALEAMHEQAMQGAPTMAGAQRNMMFREPVLEAIAGQPTMRGAEGFDLAYPGGSRKNPVPTNFVPSLKSLQLNRVPQRQFGLPGVNNPELPLVQAPSKAAAVAPITPPPSPRDMMLEAIQSEGMPDRGLAPYRGPAPKTMDEIAMLEEDSRRAAQSWNGALDQVIHHSEDFQDPTVNALMGEATYTNRPVGHRIHTNSILADRLEEMGLGEAAAKHRLLADATRDSSNANVSWREAQRRPMSDLPFAENSPLSEGLQRRLEEQRASRAKALLDAGRGVTGRYASAALEHGKVDYHGIQLGTDGERLLRDNRWYLA